MTRFDVLVLGAGPAGLALTSALVARGACVAIAAPELDDAPPRWPATYCAWADELDGIGYADVVDRRWARVTADFGAGADGRARLHDLDRAYVRVAKGALAARLWARADAAARLRGRVASASHHATHTEVVVSTPGGDSRVEATVVVDAAGHCPALMRVPEKPVPAWQTAVGRILELPSSPWPEDRAVLMDFDPAPLGHDDGPPTFLYVLPLGGGRVLVEETVLAARPGLGAVPLRDRLDRRLAHLGVHGVVREEEWVSIPMGGPLPRDPRVLGFGAAGGMIHPASGYLLPRVLAHADPVAEALLAGLTGECVVTPTPFEPGPVAAVAAGFEALWPADRRQRRALYRFGLEGLLAMPPATTRDFFHAFFQRPREDWAGYLSDTHDAPALRRVMWSLFAGVSPGMKWSLARAAFGREGLALAEAMLGV